MTKTSLSANRAGGGSKHPAHLYDTLWDEAGLVDYKIWPIWEQVMHHGPAQGRRLEIGCGIAPKIPAAGSYFIDLSPPALQKLKSHGGYSVQGDGGVLPFATGCFDLVISSAVLEHIEADQAALAEIARVLRPGGLLMLTVPVGPQYWTRFDEVVGHYRRYTAEQIEHLFMAVGFSIRSFAPSRVFHGRTAGNIMAYFITRHPRLSLWVTKKFLLPRRLQIKIEWRTEDFRQRLQDATDVHIIAEKQREPQNSVAP